MLCSVFMLCVRVRGCDCERVCVCLGVFASECICPMCIFGFVSLLWSVDVMVAGCWFVDVVDGCCSVGVGYQWLVVGCPLLIVGGRLVVVGCLL